MKKRRLKKGPIVLLFLFVFMILMYSMYDVYTGLKGNKAAEVKTIDEIPTYGYKIDETASKYVKSLFKELKKVLEEKEVDEKQYAELVGKIFLADFYSLDAAINKNDIGGLQFIYKKSQEDFSAKAKDTVYRYVENNIYHNRKQSLPLVTSVDVKNVEQKAYNKASINDAKAYYMDFEITYKTDMGYPAKASLVLVHTDKKLEIVLMTE